MSDKKQKFERITEIDPAFDKRDPDPHKDCGIGWCMLRMVLKGKKGAVYFTLETNWQLPHVTKEMLKKITLWTVCTANNIGYPWELAKEES